MGATDEADSDGFAVDNDSGSEDNLYFFLGAADGCAVDRFLGATDEADSDGFAVDNDSEELNWDIKFLTYFSGGFSPVLLLLVVSCCFSFGGFFVSCCFSFDGVGVCVLLVGVLLVGVLLVGVLLLAGVFLFLSWPNVPLGPFVKKSKF